MASLETYKAKRDFTKTAEPSGERRVAKSERPRFVIQKHAATRLHYDLRLEHEGTFHSWAVTRGPSLDPADKRLAVEVEDHPLDYGDFEGTIPKGQYGGGTVMLWDRGWFEPEPGRTFEQGLKKGHLSLTFDGERMQGGWSLVRIANDRTKSKRSNWLLIKHDDDTAHPGDHDALLEDNAFSIASGRTMEQIAAGKGKSPKPFMLKGAKTSAKAVWNSKGASPEASAEAAAETAVAPKTAPAKRARGKKVAKLPADADFQLCKLVDRPPSGPDWVHEIKFDGYRMQARVERGRATLLTRKKLDWTERFPEIAADLAALPDDALLDGEIVALDKDGNPDFSGLQAALSNKATSGLVFFVFDALFVGREDLRGLPLNARKERLSDLLDGASPRLRFVEHFVAGGDAVLASACRMGLEGIVSKRLDAPYRGGRADVWTKAKCRGGQEVVIGGWTTTGSKFRSLLAGMWKDGELTYVGRVGSGYSSDKIAALLPRLKAVSAKTSPFKGKGAPRGGPDIHWVKPELVAEIAFAGWTGDGAVRQASFKGLREDKTAAEVVPETAEARDAVEDRPTAPVRSGVARGPVVLGVALSSPDKPLWPALGPREPEVTKLDLAHYYEAVAGRLLPYVQGRPCSLIRTPEGIGGERFFQRHGGAGQSPLITLTSVSGDRKPYLQFDSAEALIAAAQIGGTELHPWNCLPGKPEIPGRFVFDLDPDEDLPFERVIAAARELKDRLEALGLAAFLKTTGGKGLHVVTPFSQPSRSPVDWPAAKAFARALCERVAADEPGAYTTNMSKKARGGRIFLDYLRNDRMATAASLLSPRARVGAPVSFPLTWSQARKGLDPKKYTIRTAPGLLKKGDPWAGYDDAAAPLKPAIAKLGKL